MQLTDPLPAITVATASRRGVIFWIRGNDARQRISRFRKRHLEAACPVGCGADTHKKEGK